MDNAPCHAECLSDCFSNVKVVFLPKNEMSLLQPLDAGIIRNLRFKYRKKLLKFLILKIDINGKATDIIREGDVLREISWIKSAWWEISDQTVINCFRKCGFRKGCLYVQELDQEKEFASFSERASVGCFSLRLYRF